MYLCVSLSPWGSRLNNQIFDLGLEGRFNPRNGEKVLPPSCVYAMSAFLCNSIEIHQCSSNSPARIRVCWDLFVSIAVLGSVWAWRNTVYDIMGADLGLYYIYVYSVSVWQKIPPSICQRLLWQASNRGRSGSTKHGHTQGQACVSIEMCSHVGLWACMNWVTTAVLRKGLI